MKTLVIGAKPAAGPMSSFILACLSAWICPDCVQLWCQAVLTSGAAGSRGFDVQVLKAETRAQRSPLKGLPSSSKLRAVSTLKSPAKEDVEPLSH